MSRPKLTEHDLDVRIEEKSAYAAQAARWARANGRNVLDTGRVQIGLLHGAAPMPAEASTEIGSEMPRVPRHRAPLLERQRVAAWLLVAAAAGIAVVLLSCQA